MDNRKNFGGSNDNRFASAPSNDDDEYVKYIRCSPNEIFCVKTGTCSRSCDETPPSHSRGMQESITKCRPGETFCLETGMCAQRCDNNENLNAATDVKTLEESCDTGKTFCVVTGTCEFKCFGGRDDNTMLKNIASRRSVEALRFILTKYGPMGSRGASI